MLDNQTDWQAWRTTWIAALKRTGDGALVEFRSVVDAVRCAVEVQNAMVERNAGVPPERRIEFRVGIHLGDVVVERVTATTTPRGDGHVYAAARYLDGWIAVGEPQGWNEESLARLRDWLNAHDR